MSPGGILFWAKCIRSLDQFVAGKEESLLELVMLVPIKAKDPFLWIKKKIGPALSLEACSNLPWPLLVGKSPQPLKEGL